MTEEAKAVLLASIESYVDKMISSGRVPAEHRDMVIDGYKKQARIA